jgi:5,10-methylenetetrahydrofolate reductase
VRRRTKMAQSFKEALNSGKFIISSEIGPPKGTNLEKMRHHIDILKDLVDGINVTDHQSSVMRFPSSAAAWRSRSMAVSPFCR